MKFQDSSSNGLKVTVGTKSVTHPRTHPPTHAPKAICPINFFKVGGIIKEYTTTSLGPTEIDCVINEMVLYTCYLQQNYRNYSIWLG